VSSGSGSGDQFRLAFQEEARELLVELESNLLEMNERPEDGELVGNVFRALHTIKGSGAMFGFEDLATFTHNLENAFDEVRKGRLTVNPKLVDLTLSALDQIRAMVAKDGGEAAADPAACTKVLTDLRSMMGTAEDAGEASGHTARGAKRFQQAAVGLEAAVESDVRQGGAPEREWKIRFAPGPDLMRNGADPLLLVRELQEIGSLTVKASTAGVPSIQELDPERCYVSWEMVLTIPASGDGSRDDGSAQGEDAIRDVFIFVEDTCELTIEPAGVESLAEIASVNIPTKEPVFTAVCAAETAAPALDEKRRSPGRRPADQPDNASSLRVPAARLDQLVDLVGELVTVQARLSELAGRSQENEVLVVAEEIERLTSALRENSMTLRMLPIRATFERFRRLVHDLARDLGKNVELTTDGAETELDKTVIDQLGDPLMHLIRNSMDHGVELPERRVASGKRPMAKIHLSARHSGASVLIAVSDDGAGIDAEAVRARAIERGLAGADDPLTEAEIFSFIFQPGFSTAKEVTDISGRGVGMDIRFPSPMGSRIASSISLVIHGDLHFLVVALVGGGDQLVDFARGNLREDAVPFTNGQQNRVQHGIDAAYDRCHGDAVPAERTGAADRGFEGRPALRTREARTVPGRVRGDCARRQRYARRDPAAHW
jgi:two-component system chemotaxis sensor kinase CheA